MYTHTYTVQFPPLPPQTLVYRLPPPQPVLVGMLLNSWEISSVSEPSSVRTYGYMILLYVCVHVCVVIGSDIASNIICKCCEEALMG